MAVPGKKKASTLGLKPKTVGKTQARNEFFPLVASLNAANAVVEITDHDEPVAVLLSYQNYLALIAKASINAPMVRESEPDLMGSVTINSDLEAAGEEIAELFKTAIDKSAGSL